MPKTPIYTAMLPESARNVMGVPHPSGRAAMRMLEMEGFSSEGYIDIFDGGPTMAAHTDQIRTVRDAEPLILIEGDAGSEGVRMMLAAGENDRFAACYGKVAKGGDGLAMLDARSAAMLGLKPGGPFLAIGR